MPWALACVLHLLLSAVVAAGGAPEKREPDGFRELRWDMGFEEARAVYPDLQVRRKAPARGGETWVCFRSGEDRVSGPVTFDSIEYLFLDGRFDGVVATVRNEHEAAEPLARKAYDHYLKTIAARFGETTEKGEGRYRNDEREVHAIWIFDGSRIHARWSSNGGNARRDVFRLEISRLPPREGRK